MGSISDKLVYMLDNVNKIIIAMQSKGVKKSDSLSFRDYVKILEEVEPAHNIMFGNTPPSNTCMLWLKCDPVDRITIGYAGELETYKNTILITQSSKGVPFKLLTDSMVDVTISIESVYMIDSDGRVNEIEAALYKDGAWTNI